MLDDSVMHDYAYVLASLESAIVQADHDVLDLSDGQVDLALDAMIRHYQAMERGYEPRPPRLGEGSQAVFDAVLPMAEVQLGLASLDMGDAGALEDVDDDDMPEMTAEQANAFVEQVMAEAIELLRSGSLEDEGLADEADEDLEDEGLTHEELIMCLKRIRKSVRFWSKQGGRRGYLDYVAQFLAGTGDVA